jgi:hypothetical protein
MTETEMPKWRVTFAPKNDPYGRHSYRTFKAENAAEAAYTAKEKCPRLRIVTIEPVA